MSAWATWLATTGVSTLFGGLALWYGLFIWAALRDPKGSEILSFSLNRQWAANRRIFASARDTGRRTGIGRMANIMLAVGITCLTAAGVIKTASLIAARQGGAG